MEPKWYSDLVAWINNNEGFLHKSLCLVEDSPGARGIFAAGEISKGDLLVRLPSPLALCGASFPSQYESGSGTRNASDWLRCIAALMQAMNEKKDSKFEKYISSLPQSYDTLLHESAWSDNGVKNYLAGTTIGKLVLEDRKSSAMKMRFEESVKPYLVANKVIDATLIEDEEHLFAVFQISCACVSTRGFHLRENKNQSDDHFGGPFLLPFIDLLNHASRPVDKCTTLQRGMAKPPTAESVNLQQAKDSFFMVAERDIKKGEEILHSYGNGLMSGQLLQTFGFVEESLVQRAVGRHFDSHKMNGITPALISRASIISACANIASSGIPQELEKTILDNPDLQDFDVWDLPEATDLEARNSNEVKMNISDELAINFSEPLSDELVTVCCAQFLPNDAYSEICGGEENTEDKALSLVSAEILEDFFLGSLIIESILYAIKIKLTDYNAIETPVHVDIPISEIPVGALERDRFMLSILSKERKNMDTNAKDRNEASETELNHSIYGLTLRIEEMECLMKLKEECEGILKSFDNTTVDGDISCAEHPSKKMKV